MKASHMRQYADHLLPDNYSSTYDTTSIAINFLREEITQIMSV